MNTESYTGINQPVSAPLSSSGIHTSSMPIPQGHFATTTPIPQPIGISNQNGMIFMPMRSASYTNPGIPVQNMNMMSPMPMQSPNIFPIQGIPPGVGYPIQIPTPIGFQPGVPLSGECIPLMQPQFIPFQGHQLQQLPQMHHIQQIPVPQMQGNPLNLMSPNNAPFYPGTVSPPVVQPLNTSNGYYYDSHAQTKFAEHNQYYPTNASREDPKVENKASGTNSIKDFPSLNSNHILASNIVSAINNLPSNTSSAKASAHDVEYHQVSKKESCYSPTRKPVVRMNIGSIKLRYFNVKGLIAKNYAQIFCLISGITHEFYSFETSGSEEWLAYKERLIKTGDNLSGQLPILIYNGIVISESVAILRFLARKIGRYGSDALADAIVDSVTYKLQTWYDDFISFLKKKTTDVNEFHAKRVKNYAFFEQMACRSNTPWLCNSAAPSLCDVICFSLIWDDIHICDKELLNSSPKLLLLYESMFEYPELSVHLQKLEKDFVNSPFNPHKKNEKIENVEKVDTVEKINDHIVQTIYENDLINSIHKIDLEQATKDEKEDAVLAHAINYSYTIDKVDDVTKIDEDFTVALGIEASLNEIEKLDSAEKINDETLAHGIAVSEAQKNDNDAIKIDDDNTAILLAQKVDEAGKIDEAEKVDEDINIINAIIESEKYNE